MRAVFASLITVLITGVPLACLAQQDTPHKVSGGCPVSPTDQIKWRRPLGGDSLTCTGQFAGTTATIQYFISNYKAVLGVSTDVGVPGTVAGWPVRWYVSQTDSGQLRRDVILRDSNNEPTIHITVVADNPADLDGALKVVEKLKL
jgi:hypothetical protein